MKKFLLLLLLLTFPTLSFANDITRETTITVNGEVFNKLTDNNENSYISIKKGNNIIVDAKENIYGIYIIYELTSQNGTITYNNKNINIGENKYLHEFIDINKEFGNTKELSIQYGKDVKIAEIYIIGDGDIPDYVEIWEPPLDSNTDLLLFSTHSDDEQLFFLGLLPTYVAKGAHVQVVYYVNHNDNPKRLHEQLHGLYTVGIRNYPIIGFIPDAYSETLNGAIKNIEKAGLTVEDAINYQVEMIRRFKPSVIVGHDEAGEYSHGQHILNTHTLKIALEKTNDETYHKESYEKYGLWDTPKTYLHLYKENKIIMDYDTPLNYFNGLTAYEVSKKGYSKHNSQQWTWFTKWINGTNNSYSKSTDIKTYSPNQFGLYRTLVGNDIQKNDMFENIVYRKDIEPEENNYKDEITETVEEIVDNPENYMQYIIPVTIILLILLTFIIIKKRRDH